MDDKRVESSWYDPEHAASQPRNVFVHDELRYAQRANQRDIELDGFINYHWLTSPEANGRPKVMLEAGINAPAEVSRSDAQRRPVIAIRSSPWKAGHESNPWHDEFDLDHGHVRYFGDHKPSTVGLPGATRAIVFSSKPPASTPGPPGRSVYSPRHCFFSGRRPSTATAERT